MHSNSLSYCRVCNSANVVVAATRKKFPLYIWPLEHNENTIFETIVLYICSDCGHIQLQDMAQQFISEIYRDTAFNIENRAQNINRYKQLTRKDISAFDNAKILEIGGGRNSFLGVLPENAEKWVADFTVDENILTIADGVFIGDFIETKITQKEFDYVVMFHVLEHFNNPASVIKKITGLLKEGGRLVVEVPNFFIESKKIPFYTLFHMHISLFTEHSLVSLMNRFGFKCSEIYENNNVLLAEFTLMNREVYTNSVEQSRLAVNRLSTNIDFYRERLKSYFLRLNCDGNIAIFGAGGSSTLFLYNFPFIMNLVKFAFDNDNNKIGRFICDGGIEVIPLNKVTQLEIENVIILDSAHKKYFNNAINIINVMEITS